ncbi:lytic transglycosylase domain-containing protein [Burkholderia seminalis]|uniref:VgrG-related protein n=1 Tax=Burkholderia seminalis TaxID=488731 RepID=UPI001CF4EF2F|nr:lytic transglycosylase domain-containing protein [Burkholderia seminalis]MCA7950775.1 lytic transglycosylase domain-containing protein [Burkholderia seminalis]
MSKTTPKKKHHPSAAPKSAPKPAEPADTPLSWAYPFTPAGKNDAADPMTYFSALAKCENGFYPLGVSGMWHGGVHFADGSAEMLKQDGGVRAIADGKIVAYRLDTKYEETTYPNNAGRAHYSTGFVLVRHELKLPPKPAAKEPAKPAPALASAHASTNATPPAAAPANNSPSDSQPANDKSLVFFSLYMHTMDWAGYQKAIEQAKSNPKPDPALPVPMSYWEGDRYYRVGSKAKDKQTVPKRKAPAQPPVKRTNGADDLPINNTDPNESSPADRDQDADLPATQTGLRIRELPNGTSKIIGILPTGAEIIAGEGDPTHPDWIKIKSIKSGTVLSAEVGKPVSPQAPWSYVFKGDLDAVVDPKPLDTVVILKEPQRVKAGEVVAHVGQYQWPNKASPMPPKPNYPMLHLEVFAGPDLKAFIDQSRARAKELNDKNKPLLEIEPGAKLVSEVPAPDQKLTQSGLKLVPIGDAKGSRWIKVQPKSVTTVPAKGKQKAKQTFADVGKPMWVESSLANTISSANVAGWQNFPLDVSKASGPGADFRDVLRRTGLDKLGADNVAIDDKGHHWWNITIGSKDGSARQGWVCDTGHDGVQFRSPWEWPGFEWVDNGSVSPADMFKRHIHATEQYLADEEGTEFKGAAGKVNAGELITKLETAIDTNHDGKVTAQELKHALETRWMAEAVSHLVVRNETEWGGGMGKWEELTPLMKKQTEMWKTELDRLAKLQWWEQIKGVDGFPTDLSPWHFHPIGLIGNFLATVRKRRDYDLGGLSTYYETGGRGPIAISGGQGDPGGVSYGSYQFTSQTRQKHGAPIIGGRVKEFVSWSGFPWPNAFEGLTPGSSEFSDKWRELVKSDESKFHDAEHAFTRETHYDIQIKTIEIFARVDMRYHSHALNDVIWSTCVQHGPSTDVITTAMSSLEPPTETRDYDVKLIDAIYAERGRKNSDGKLVRFIHSSSHGQENVAKRFVSERARAQHELANEKDY